MADRRSLVGRTHELDTVTIDPDNAEDFSSVVGHEPEFRNGRRLVSPFYAAQVVAPLWRRVYQAPELDTGDARVLHAEQRTLWHRHMHAGQRLRAALVVRDVVGFGFNDAVVIRCRLHDEDGAPVVTMESTLAVQGDSGLAPRTGRLANPRRGESAASVSRFLGEDLPKRYADAADDHNPLHLDDEAAREAGHPGRILHGMCTLAVGVTALANEISGGSRQRLGFVRTRFLRPVRPGTTVGFEAHSTGAAGFYTVAATHDGRAILRNCVMGLSKEQP